MKQLASKRRVCAALKHKQRNRSISRRERFHSNCSKPQVIHIASRKQLSCCHCAFHLWKHVKSLTHLSAADLIYAMEGFFRDLDVRGFMICFASGKEWPIPLICEIFPEFNKKGKKTDAGRRWINWYRKKFRGGVKPNAKSEMWVRMICIELYVHATVAKYTRGSETPRCSMTHFPLGW
jgi:hypothetical protein